MPATVRPTRTVFGGRARQGGRPLVTYVLIGLCVLVNVLQYVPGLDVTGRFAFAPAFAGEEPWRFLTAAFLHATGGTYGVAHILFNMYALFLVGPYLEHVFGRSRFVGLYLLSALGGSVAFELLTPDVNQLGQISYTVGASGAVFGLFGALLVVQRRLRMPLNSILGVLGVNLLLGFFLPGIAWQAHLGGLLVGAAAAGPARVRPQAGSCGRAVDGPARARAARRRPGPDRARRPVGLSRSPGADDEVVPTVDNAWGKPHRCKSAGEARSSGWVSASGWS